MSKKIAVLVDAGYLRVALKRAGQPYTADNIEKICVQCALAHEEIVRILYYDCEPFEGELKLPVSKQKRSYRQTSSLLHALSLKDLFAVRRGVLKFRGFAIKKNHQPSNPLQDSDFDPTFEQKGVDMRIGLDMALFSANRSVELIALMTSDTDCIPAMKYARRAGIQVALISLPGVQRTAPELFAHTDFKRQIIWPSS